MSVSLESEQALLPLGMGTQGSVRWKGLPDVVSAAIALGALTVGGPLSGQEQALVSTASFEPSPSVAGQLRAMILTGGDPLGNALCDLRPLAERRRAGMFYTPGHVVRSMADWVMERNPARLIDPGCGSGRFSAEAARRAPDLAILALDIDPAATLACRANLAVLGARCATVVNLDYITFEPETVQGPTAFVGNPPYVRHHSLSSAQKLQAKNVAEKLGLSVSGLAGLHVHFFLATMRNAQPGDFGSFITSSEWLDVGYGRVLRQALLDGLGANALHLLDPRTVTFKDAMTTALITCFEAGAAPKRVRLRKLPFATERLDLGSGGVVRTSSQLQREPRWSPLFTKQPGKRDESLIPLGELVRVSRGVVTGANAFFVMALEQAQRLGLARYGVPVLRSAREVFEANGVISRASVRHVLIDPPRTIDLDAEEHNNLRAYLSEGVVGGVASGYICRHREPWWHVGAKIPPVIATYMARQPPAFALNPGRVAILNVFHGLFPRTPLTDEELRELVAFLNSHRESLRGKGRTYHGGLEKFEPSEMESLLVAPPRSGALAAASFRRLSVSE